MKNKKIIIIAIIAVLLVIAAVIVINNKKDIQGQSDKANGLNSMDIPADGVNTEDSIPSADILVDSPEMKALAVMPGSPEAPKQEVVETSKISEEAIKLTVSDSGFEPKEFTIKSGQEVSLAVTSSGDNVHVFLFPNASLMGLTMMVSNNETKVINFTAPAAGSYEFRDDIPTYRDNVGTMIVK
jgi:plastocyanin